MAMAGPFYTGLRLVVWQRGGLRRNSCETQRRAPGVVQPDMMDGMMGPTMGWMMGLGWLAALVLLGLVIALVVWLVRSPGSAGRDAGSGSAGGTAAKIALGVLAVVGGIALVGATAMAVMHFGMGCCS